MIGVTRGDTRSLDCGSNGKKMENKVKAGLRNGLKGFWVTPPKRMDPVVIIRHCRVWGCQSVLVDIGFGGLFLHLICNFENGGVHQEGTSLNTLNPKPKP